MCTGTRVHHEQTFKGSSYGGALAEHDAEGGRLAAVQRRVGPGRYCSPRRTIPFNSITNGYRCVSMTSRAMGQVDIARQDTGCH